MHHFRLVDKGILIATASCVLMATACKKDKISVDDAPVSPLTGTRQEFTLDSIYLYARQTYLWNEALPDYAGFNPRKYAGAGPDLSTFNDELFDLSQLAVNPATGNPYEAAVTPGSPKYSYLTQGLYPGKVAAVVGVTQPAVIKDTVLQSGSNNIGYLAMGSFPKLSTCQAALDEVFAKFASAGMQHIVIDLRSNGGGYIETAQYVAELIAPATLNGSVIYSEQYNSQMQTGKAGILKNQLYLDEDQKPVTYNGRNATMADVDYTEAGNTYRFAKKGSLNTIKNVYFIVSGSTASASELLINCLRPYLNVKLAGTKTYGKPVGFFGIAIDTYTVFLSGCLIRNAAGSADYFDGMPVDIPAVPDGAYPLGNPAETCLSKVLYYLNTGKIASTKAIATNTLNTGSTATQIKQPVDAGNVLMLENRFKLKK